MKALHRQLRPLLGALAAQSLLINLLYLVPAVFMLQVFDRVLSSGSQETLVVLLGGTGFALLVLFALDFLRGRLQHVLGGIVEERLSPPVVRAIVAAAARTPHAATTEGVRDVTALRSLFSANGLIALLDAPWIFVYVGVIWLFHPVLGMAAAAAGLLMLFLAWLNDRLGRGALEELQQESRRASGYIETSLRNAEVLQALGMTPSLLERWHRLQAQIAEAQHSASRGGAAFAAATRLVRQAVQIVMLSLGAWLVLSQEASAGIMIATTVLLGRAVQPIEQLVGSWRLLTDARAAYGRLAQLLPPGEGEAQKFALPRPEGRLGVQGASLRARGSENLVLNNLTFALAPGEAMAVLGPSGAGKSTLARLLTGIWPASAGAVRLDGTDLASWPREQIGPWIGYVPQDVELFEGSVAENIARLGEADPEAVVAAARRAEAHEMILALPQGYDTPVGGQGLRLSPGQRQRVALARALYGDPRLVVLDEPNSNLDGAGEVALAKALSGLRKEGVTCVVVTHRPALVAHVDKILVLAGGRVQQFGPATQVMKAMQQQMHLMGGEKAA